MSSLEVCCINNYFNNFEKMPDFQIFLHSFTEIKVKAKKESFQYDSFHSCNDWGYILQGLKLNSSAFLHLKL